MHWCNTEQICMHSLPAQLLSDAGLTHCRFHLGRVNAGGTRRLQSADFLLNPPFLLQSAGEHFAGVLLDLGRHPRKRHQPSIDSSEWSTDDNLPLLLLVDPLHVWRQPHRSADQQIFPQCCSGRLIIVTTVSTLKSIYERWKVLDRKETEENE